MIDMRLNKVVLDVKLFRCRLERKILPLRLRTVLPVRQVVRICVQYRWSGDRHELRGVLEVKPGAVE